MRITHADLGSLFDCSVSWETGSVDITTHYCNHAPNHDDGHECGCGEKHE